MGETLTPFGFADFKIYEEFGGKEIVPGKDAKIDFESDWATGKVSEILKTNPSAPKFALKAQGGGGDWDIKSKSTEGVYFGSKLFGKYASARDAGNFVAGAVAQNSIFPNLLLDYGYGVYNMADNKVGTSLSIITNDVGLLFSMPKLGATLMNVRANYGENPLSKMGIEAGKTYIKNQK